MDIGERKLHVLAGVFVLLGVAFSPQLVACLVRSGAVEAARAILGPHPLHAALMVALIVYLLPEGWRR